MRISLANWTKALIFIFSNVVDFSKLIEVRSANLNHDLKCCHKTAINEDWICHFSLITFKILTCGFWNKVWELDPLRLPTVRQYIVFDMKPIFKIQIVKRIFNLFSRFSFLNQHFQSLMVSLNSFLKAWIDFWILLRIEFSVA